MFLFPSLLMLVILLIIISMGGGALGDGRWAGPMSSLILI